MTRTLFFLTCLAAMIMAMCAVLIRLELAHPGVSPLFMGPLEAPNGTLFSAVVATHGVFGYLAVMLLGTAMAAAARGKGAPLSRFIVSLGCLTSLATLAVFALSHVPATLLGPAPDQPGVGWTLFPPLASTMGASALDHITVLAGLPSAQYIDLSRVLVLPAAALLWLGAYAMLSTQSGMRYTVHLGVLLTVAVLVLIAPSVLSFEPQLGSIGFVAVALPFLAFAAIRIVDGGPVWVLLLALGVVVSLIAQAGIELVLLDTNASGTMAEVATLYIFPLGLVWFALPAFIMFTARRTDPWPTWAPWAIAAALTFTLSAWLVPMIRLGLDGQAMRYVDYPDDFAADNLLVTVTVGQFVLTYLVIIALTRRAAR